MKRKLVGGNEYAALTDEHRHLIWRTGERKAIKAAAHRRERRQGRQQLWANA